jgi:MraZ protein
VPQVFVGSAKANKVDRKGRVSVPADFRKQVAGQEFHGIYVYAHHLRPCLVGFGDERMQKYIDDLEELDEFSEEYEELAQVVFSDAERLGFDSEGRIMLPQHMMEHCAIAEAAAFVARGPTFEIWEPGTYEQQRQDARERAAKKGIGPRKAGRKQASGEAAE